MDAGGADPRHPANQRSSLETERNGSGPLKFGNSLGK